MLLDDTQFAAGAEHLDWSYDSINVPEVVVSASNPVMRGALDVISFNSLIRIIRYFCSQGKSEQDALSRAVAQTINLNGSIARELLDGGR